MIQRYRTWTVFAVALCSLLALMLIPSLSALHRSEQIYREVRVMQENYERTQRVLEGLAGNMALISITIREFLLDTSPEAGRLYRRRLADGRVELDQQIAELKRIASSHETGTLQRLQQEVDAFWDAVMPVFDWPPRKRIERGTYFLRSEHRPTRQSVLALASEIGRVNTDIYRSQSERLNASEEEFRRDLKRILLFALLVGFLVSAASIIRIRWLEGRTREQHTEAQRTGEELRNLSTRLRHAQEQERKQISRELHDEVGQKLTALRMELGGIDRLRMAGESEFQAQVQEMKTLAEQSLRMIRDIATGLRPSMLDDLGLGPAIQRHARDVSRRCGVPVTVHLNGDVDHLPDRHRTYIYRIVQESLNNCAKHSRAKSIEVNLTGRDRDVELVVRDDGIGFDPIRSAQTGLGLIGIDERVRELGGSMRIDAAPGKGTVLRARIHVDGGIV